MGIHWFAKAKSSYGSEAARLGMARHTAVKAAGWIYRMRPTEMWLSVDLLPHDLPFMVGHEASHLADHRKQGETTEARANAFGRQFTNRIGDARHLLG